MLSPQAKPEWTTILVIGVLLAAACVVVGLWPLAILLLLAAAGLALFFRDPVRTVPSQRNAMIAPADGKITSVHEVEHYEPLEGPGVCVRIFLSVLDVHINRCPCHGRVRSVSSKPGKYTNAMNPQSAEDNASTLTVLEHPVKGYPLAAVRQVAGMLARTIVCTAEQGRVLQRGERIGLIKLGSTTELYVPKSLVPEVQVKPGQKVRAGMTVLLTYTPASEGGSDGEPAAVPARLFSGDASAA
jgi:phosphatidylserine decarboxylase